MQIVEGHIGIPTAAVVNALRMQLSLLSSGCRDVAAAVSCQKSSMYVRVSSWVLQGEGDSVC